MGRRARVGIPGAVGGGVRLLAAGEDDGVLGDVGDSEEAGCQDGDYYGEAQAGQGRRAEAKAPLPWLAEDRDDSAGGDLHTADGSIETIRDKEGACSIVGKTRGL